MPYCQPMEARIENIEDYMEMLYEDEDRQRAVQMFLELSNQYDNLAQLVENDVLIGALTRVFREESKKNFELAINIATIFYNASRFSQFSSIFSQHKIGAVALQLVEHELRRWALWDAQIRDNSTLEKNRQRLEFAVQRQAQLLTVCLELLLNLAADVKVEYKMVKRGLLSMLERCLDHGGSHNTALLITITCKFLWKLSTFAENQIAMASLKIVEKCVRIVSTASHSTSSPELKEIIYALLFNLSFDRTLCRRMTGAELLNCMARNITESEITLDLLYQLSTLEETKAIFAFVDVIPTLMRMLMISDSGGRYAYDDENADNVAERRRKRVAGALLVNVALEKRNAQLIAGADAAGIDALMSRALERADNDDVLDLKLASNLAAHRGPMQAMFIKWLPQLLENAIGRLAPSANLPPGGEAHKDRHRSAALSSSLLVSPSKRFGLECLRLAANLNEAPWAELDDRFRIIEFLSAHLDYANRAKRVSSKNISSSNDGDEDEHDMILLQVILMLSTICDTAEMSLRVLVTVDRLLALLDLKENDAEFVLQIVYVFARLMTHPDVATRLCAFGESVEDDKGFVERLLARAYDANVMPHLRQLCDQTLQIVVETNPRWAQRVAEARFRRHNAVWMEMVLGSGDRELAADDDQQQYGEITRRDDFDGVILDADEVLGANDSVG